MNEKIYLKLKSKTLLCKYMSFANAYIKKYMKKRKRYIGDESTIDCGRDS